MRDRDAHPTDEHQRNWDGVRRTLAVAAVIGALATVPVIFLLESYPGQPWIGAVDWLIWGVFPWDLASRAKVERRRRELLLSLIVVVLSFPLLPTVLSVVRLTRLVRLLRIMRLAGTISHGTTGLRAVLGRRGLLYVIALSCFFIVAGGGALALLEPTTVKGGFQDGVWWAIVTASTVGYGDIAPTSLAGRLIAVAIMLAGIGLVSTLAASITAHFVGQAENTELAEMKARLVRIERLVEILADRQAPDDASRLGSDGEMVRHGEKLNGGSGGI